MDDNYDEPLFGQVAPELDARYHNKYAAWTRVVICANSSPPHWYPNEAPSLLDAFRRRLMTVIWVGTRAIATSLNLTAMFRSGRNL